MHVFGLLLFVTYFYSFGHTNAFDNVLIKVTVVSENMATQGWGSNQTRLQFSQVI